jgi:hypothetical protein
MGWQLDTIESVQLDFDNWGCNWFVGFAAILLTWYIWTILVAACMPSDESCTITVTVLSNIVLCYLWSKISFISLNKQICYFFAWKQEVNFCGWNAGVCLDVHWTNNSQHNNYTRFPITIISNLISHTGGYCQVCNLALQRPYRSLPYKISYI